MSPETLFANIKDLPPIARQEIFDYINYVMQKYKEDSIITEPTNEYEISRKGEEFLEKRLTQFQSNKTMSSWDEVKNRIYTRNNWD